MGLLQHQDLSYDCATSQGNQHDIFIMSENDAPIRRNNRIITRKPALRGSKSNLAKYLDFITIYQYFLLLSPIQEEILSRHVSMTYTCRAEMSWHSENPWGAKHCKHNTIIEQLKP